MDSRSPHPEQLREPCAAGDVRADATIAALRPGDLLTFVQDRLVGGRARWFIAHGSVLSLYDDGARFSAFVGGAREVRLVREEGVSWIRGTFPPESEEACALLATFTLMYLSE